MGTKHMLSLQFKNRQLVMPLVHPKIEIHATSRIKVLLKALAVAFASCVGHKASAVA